MRRFPLLLLAGASGVLGMALAGCSSVSTSNQPIGEERVRGQLYYLPQGKLRITGEWKNPSSAAQSLFAVTIVEELEADPRARFYLRTGTNPFYDDDTQITVNSKGLLTTVEAVTEDRSAAIVSSLATTGVDALQFAAGGGVGAVDVQGAVARPAIPFRPFSFVFDPANPAERSEIARRVEKCGFILRVTEQEVQGVPLRPPSWSANARDVLAHGVVFRPLKPWRVILDSSDDSIAALRESRLVHLPDKEHPLLLDYRRVPFVKKGTSALFVDGTLRAYSRKVPSPVLGFLGIPKAVIGAVAPLPLELKQTQITNLRAAETLRELEGSKQ